MQIAEASPKLVLHEGVTDHLGQVALNQSRCTELMLSEGFSEEFISDFNIHFYVNADEIIKEYFSKRYERMILGFYRPSDKNVYLNARLLAKKKGRAPDECNRVLRHEIGHALDDYNEGLDMPSNPDRDLALGCGGLVCSTILPASIILVTTGDVEYMISAGVIGFIASGTAMGAVINYLDKRELSPEGKNEAYANDFEARNASYSDLIILSSHDS